MSRTTRVAIAALATAALGLTGPLWAQDVDIVRAADEWKMYYFDQPRELELDTTRVAVLDAPGRALLAVQAELALHGIVMDQVEPLHSGWHVVGLPQARRGQAATPRLVEELVRGAVGSFISPVFVDELGGPMIVTPDILVRFEEGVGADEAEALLAELGGGEILEHEWGGKARAYRVRPATRSAVEVLDVANALARLPQVRYAEPDVIASAEPASGPDDPYFPHQWALQNTGQNVGGPCGNIEAGVAGFDLGVLDAWPISTGSHEVIVLVMDDGLQFDHPDLMFDTELGHDATGDGSGGWPLHACENHGTPVAGLIGAMMNNAYGAAGAAPDVRVAFVRMARTANESCGRSVQASWIVDALEWGQQIGATVTNLSWSLGQSSAIADKYAETRSLGMVHFASAGNGGTSNLIFPARVPEVNAVAALDKHGDLAWFSSWGEGLAFSAPGIHAIAADREAPYGYRSTDDHTCFGGTSAASPYAAAVAALIRSVESGLTAEQIEHLMQNTTITIGSPGYNTRFGWGLVNAGIALRAMTGIQVPGDHETIQAAIDAAQNGDMIVVAPGTWNEAIDFGGKELHLRSSGGPNVTILSGDGVASSVITIAGEQGPQTIVHGFTITGGTGTLIADETFGGGIYIAGSSPQITNCRFEDNSADHGAPIFSDAASQPAIGTSYFCGNSSNVIAGQFEDLGGNEICPTPGDPTLAPLEAFSIQQGARQSGGLEQIKQSDDAYLVVQSRFGQGRHRTATIVDARSPWGMIERLDLKVETGVDSAHPVTTFIDLWNVTSSEWDQIDSFSQPAADTVKQYLDIPGAAGYVTSAGLIRARIRTEANYHRHDPPYNFRIDHVEVVVVHEPPSHFDTIQQMIDAATPGQVITIGPGSYNEAIDFNGKAVHLRSSEGPEVTILDASGLNASVVTAISGEGADTIIEGFTITGGSGTQDNNERLGGGMYIRNSSPTIVDCLIVENSADFGGGMFVWNGQPTVSESALVNNSASGGAGIYNYFGGNSSISDTLFQGNIASANGAGMQNQESQPEVVNCAFIGNAAGDSPGGGGGILSGWNSTVMITNSVFEENTTAASEGGAILTLSGSTTGVGGSYFCNNAPDDIAGDWYNTGNNEFCGIEPGVIQQAINDAQPGAVITIPPGIYNEAIDFLGKSIHLRSSDGPELTIIDGSGLRGSVVRVASGEGPGTILEGFTITGGIGTLTSTGITRGGGAYVLDSHLDIVNCIFKENAAWGGAGVQIWNSYVAATNTVFSDNHADGAGGGLNVTAGSDAVVSHSLFEGNTAGSNGGAFQNTQSVTEVTNSVFNDNVAPSGAGALMLMSEGTFIDCVFKNNIAHSGSGGGILVAGAVVGVGDSEFCDNLPDHISGDWNDLGGNQFCPIDPPGVPPTTPTDFTATAVPGRLVALAWSHEASSTDHLEIHRQRRQGNNWRDHGDITLDGSESSHMDSPGNGTFRYRMRAVNQHGESSWTGWQQVTTFN